MLTNKIRTLFPAFIFTAASALAGVLNYLFQIYTARNLSLTDYGSLNSWLATLAVISIVGSFLQIKGNFYYFTEKQIIRVLLPSLIFLFSIVLSLQFINYRLSVFFGVMYGVSTVVYAWLAGQMLIRKKFVVVGASYMINSICKFLFPILVGQAQVLNIDIFYCAIALSTLPGIFITFFYCVKNWNLENAEVPQAPAGKLLPSFIIASLFVILPQFDIFVVREFLSQESLGLFAQVLLLAKGIIFLSLILAQILLPYQISGKIQFFNSPKKNLIAFSLLVFLGAISSWFLGPFILKIATGNDFSEKKIWILAANLSALFGSLLLIIVQSMTSSAYFKRSLVILFCYFLIYLFFKINSFGINVYLCSIAIIHFILLVYFYALSKKLPPAAKSLI